MSSFQQQSNWKGADGKPIAHSAFIRQVFMECLLRPGPFDRHGHLAEKQSGLGLALVLEGRSGSSRTPCSKKGRNLAGLDSSGYHHPGGCTARHRVLHWVLVQGKYHRTGGVRRGRCPCVLGVGPGASGKQGGSRIKTPLNSQSGGQWEREADSTTDHPKLTALTGEI